MANWYSENMKGVGDLILPQAHPNATHVYHLYVIRTQRRDELQEYLKNKGIGTLIHYPIPPHLQEAYQDLGFKEGDFPIAEELANTSLSLPIWPGLKEKEIHVICQEIQGFFKDV